MALRALIVVFNWMISILGGAKSFTFFHPLLGKTSNLVDDDIFGKA